MALIKIPKEMGSTPGIVDNSNATAITIDSSENVGINIAPTSYKLTVNSGATTETTAASIGYNGDVGTNLYINTDHGNNLVSLYASGDVSKEMRFLSGTLEVMRLGTTGNLLLGTSSVIGGAGGSGAQLFVKQSAISNGISSVANSNDNYVRMLHTGTIGKIETTYGTGSYTPLTLFTGGAERMRIDSSGNITQTGANSADFLIKAPTDNASLTLQAGASDSGAEGAFVNFLQNTTYKWQMGMDTDNGFRWYNYAASSEAMRIDSSGNLLVGKTSTAFGTAGAALYASGDNDFVNDGNVMSLNRLNSDGSIFTFYKDSSPVGSIGTASGYLAAGSTNLGLYYNGATTEIYPVNTATTGNLDGTTNLGRTTARWKDLYLSGGAYLGGTAAANKLDDYEEGTWTAGISGVGGNAATVNTVHGYYTKIGRNVNIYCYLNSINLALITSGTYVILTGLPFQASSYSDIQWSYHRGGNAITGGYIQSGASHAYLVDSSGVEIQQSANETITALIGSASYMTNS